MDNSKKVAESGLLLGIFAVMLTFFMYVPFAGFFMLICFPIPFVLIAVKQPFQWSFGFLFLACCISVLIGSIHIIPVILLFGMTGIILGWQLSRNESPGPLLVSTVLAFLAGLLLLYAFLAVFLDIHFIEESTSFFRQGYEESAKILDGWGRAPSAEDRERVFESLELMNTLLPSLLVMVSLLMAVLILSAARPIVKRFTEKRIPVLSIKELRLPSSLLWYYLIVMVFSFLLQNNESGGLYSVLSNFLFILQFFVLIQGFSFLFYFTAQKGWPKAVPLLAVALSFLLPGLLSFIRIFGIIDLGFPIRKQIQKK
ncbi:YybS family protein [Bacillus sp. M6-12]|uniref:YybS family protein n=1 Tax=Bacillus sp. M6-12 TaxID=2054166 RepID=UPI00115A86A6|nr:DUF2232 domain-containing protein [Bacillus sp. M6-12]